MHARWGRYLCWTARLLVVYRYLVLDSTDTFWCFLTDTILTSHEDTSKIEAFDCVRRILKSAPDWNNGRTLRKQSKYMYLYV